MQCSGALSSFACEKDFIDPSKRVGIMKCTKTWIGCHYAIDERMVVGVGGVKVGGHCNCYSHCIFVVETFK